MSLHRIETKKYIIRSNREKLSLGTGHNILCGGGGGVRIQNGRWGQG